MLCVDGSDIANCFFALALQEGGALCVIREHASSRTLGNELPLFEDFLRSSDVPFEDISAIGVVHAGGSAGALRSVLSLFNALAIPRRIPVYHLSRDERGWNVLEGPFDYALPRYDRPSHTTPSHKDALGRKSSTI